MKTVFFISRNDFESAWQSSSSAVTAAALGEEVICIFSFAALRGHVEARFGAEKPTAAHQQSAARAENLGAAAPQAMLTQARQLGARFLACDTTVKICGFNAETLLAEKKLDAVEGLTALWRHTSGATVLTF